ncbi:MAG: endonuclease/exonuclease/phosphatase family protein [Bacteroidaceae bacterium]|nr:endonuclease/exonuclease/phosphatase family protein [Bacteroidaceae bacterium]
MRKISFFLLLVLVALACGRAQNAEKQYGLYAVAFYNQENLFDTIHDAGKNDYEFLPNGSYHWDKNKYENKLKNMSRALLDLGTDKLPGIGASIIGLSEVENSHVLEDLTNQPEMKARGLRYIHIEGPDRRGVDCALLYNPKFFTPQNWFLKPYVYENGDTTRATRGYLTVQGRLAGEPLTVIVCHWPSRFSTSYFREIAGKQVRQLTDSIHASNPSMRIIVMGDMNDDPDNKSMAKLLGARRSIEKVKDGDFYNPWWDVLRKQGQGTLSYQGGWNLFDQIVLSRNLLDIHNTKNYRYLKLYDYHIFKRDYLIQQEGKFKGSPKRTTSGGAWLNGYSDHLPTVVYLIKEKK